MTRALAISGIIAFAVLLVLFAGQLRNGGAQRPLRSALVGHALTPFSLPPLQGRTKALKEDGLAIAHLTQGRVTVVNFFASWCIECRLEGDALDALGRRQDVALAGIDYKDTPGAGAAFLSALGDPYGRIGNDETGRTAIDWGVYGVPETFVVDGTGRVVLRFTGPLTMDAVKSQLEPIIQAAVRTP